MKGWKIMFLSKWVICRFHVNLPGCIVRNNLHDEKKDINSKVDGETAVCTSTKTV